MVTPDNVFFVPVQAKKHPKVTSNEAKIMRHSYLILQYPIMHNIVHYIHYPNIKNISSLRLWIMNNLRVENVVLSTQMTKN